MPEDTMDGENSAEQQFFATVLHLDDHDQIKALMTFAQDRSNNPNHMLFAVTESLIQGRIRAAYVISKTLAVCGFRGPAIALGVSLGGMVFNNGEDFEYGMAEMASYGNGNRIDAFSAEQQATFYNSLILSTLIKLLDLIDLDKDRLLSFCAQLPATIPLLCKLFNNDAVVSFLSATDMESRETTKTRLLKKRDFLKTGLALADKDENFIEFIQNRSHTPDEIILLLAQLITKRRIRPAFICAMILDNTGYQSPLIAFTLCFGGLVYRNLKKGQTTLVHLRSGVRALSEEQQKIFYLTIFSPVMMAYLNNVDLAEREEFLQTFELLKAGVPLFESLFDWEANVPTPTLEALRQRGRAKARLTIPPLPPADRPRQPRRVLIAMREAGLPYQPWFDLSNVGPRIEAGMKSYGWHADFFGMKLVDIWSEFETIKERCLQEEIELLILDYDIIAIMAQEPACAQMIEKLKQEKPSIQIMAFVMDTWWHLADAVKESAANFDFFWTSDSPDLPLWRDPVFANKVLQSYFPIGVHFNVSDKPLSSEIYFQGSLLSSWLRKLWFAASKQMGLPIHVQITSHHADGLSALDSYAIYMQKIATAPCCLNLSMRPDFSLIVPGRSHEVLISGSLLIQETTPGLDSFFVAGEHYLEFSNVGELAAIVRFIAEHPEDAEEIRRRGHAFAMAHYCDDKLIGYVDQLVFSQ